jgi:hypothetical protein
MPQAVGPEVSDAGRPSAESRAAAQTVQDSGACAEAYGTTLFRPVDHLCTLDLTANAAQACGGDSGSPVLVTRDGHPAVAAVVTFGGETRGRDCGEGLPDVSERVLPHAALITATPTALAPYAARRVRVHRSGATLRCVIGAWQPAGARFTVRWWRVGRRRTVRDQRTGGILVLPGHRVAVGGGRATRPAGARPLGCTVTARTAGGWATEDSYNQR